MSDGSQYLSIESLRARMTYRLIPYLFVALTVNMAISLARIPVMGFQPSMALHIALSCAAGVLLLFKRTIRPGTAAIVMAGTLSSLFIAGVASLGLLSVTFIAGPILALYLMLLGFPRSAKLSIVAVIAYLCVMAALFVSGVLDAPVSPDAYLHSAAAWIMMIAAVGGVSIAIVAPFELIPTTLHGSEERFRVAFENANIGICLTGLDGRLLRVNDAVCTMFGYPRQKLETMSVADLTHPDDRGSTEEFMARAGTSGPATISLEKRYVDSRGAVVWANVNSAVVRDTAGVPLHLITHIQNVTQKKEADAALRLNEERLSLAVAASGAGLWDWNVATNGCYLSPRFCEILGYAEGDVQPNNAFFQPITHPEDYPLLAQSLADQLGGRSQHSDCECRMRRKTGEYIWVRIVGRVVERDGTGGAMRMIGTFSDISDRKEAEARLRESEEFHRRVIENASGVPFRLIFGPTPGCGRYDYIGENIEKITGVPASAFSERMYHDMVREVQPLSPAIMRDIGSARETMIAGKIEQYKADVRLIDAKGNERWVNDTSIPLRDKGTGAVVGAMGMLMEITERVRAEEAVRQSEKKYREIYDEALEGMYRTSVEGRSIEANKAMAQMLGFASAEETLAAITDTAHQVWVDSEERTRYAAMLVGQDVVRGYECRFRRRDGRVIWVSQSTRVVRDSEGRPLYFEGFVQDITERKHSEERINWLNRTYAVLSNINQLIVRERDRDSMFQKACQIAIDDGGFLMAWVGLLDDSTGRVEPVASAGASGGYIETLNIAADNSPRGRGPTGRAIREGRVFIANDIAHDDFMAPWRDKALSRGFRSSCALPLWRDGRPVGVITFYSGVANFFESDEMRLLEELAMDISFALMSLALEEKTRRGAEALQKSEELYRLIARNISDVIWTLDPYTEQFTYMSPSVERLRGFTAAEVMAAPLRDCMTPESYLRIGQILPRQLSAFNAGDRSFGPQRLEVDQPRKDGSLVATEVAISVIPDAAGRAKEILGVTRDITERKQAEESLIRLNKAVEASGEVIFMTDREGTFTFVNQAFSRVYGYSAEDVVGRQTPRILKSGEQSPEKYRSFWEALLAKRIVRGEWRNRARDGRSITVDGTANPILDGKGSILGFLAIQRDVTEQRSVEEQMRQAQKMESIGTLASGIAHDFNNILSIIMGHASLVERFRQDPERLAKSVASILTAASRGASVVRQMLTFARKNEVEFKPILINDSIAEIEKLLSETFPKTVTVVSQMGKGLPLITADGTQIHQVLLNLCINARDAMDGVGTLTLTSQAQPGGGLRPRFVKAVHPSYVVVTVTDTGAGMDAETQRRIFEPFFTTKELGKGTGLGLSVVFGIMESHGGFVDVVSSPGEGTTFALYFPVRATSLDEAEPIPLRVEATLSGTETILLIEDEESLRNSVGINLTLNGYSPLMAEDGAHALKLYREKWRDTAVVVSDFGLPGSNGHQVFRDLKAMNPAIKFILASGYIDPEKKAEIIRDGVRVFLQKPYAVGDLLRKIRDVIDGR